MNQKQIETIKRHLIVRNGTVRTTSLDVSNFFDKKHLHVLEAIRNLECPTDFTESNFRFSEYKDPTGRMLPMVEMTRKGFSLLGMGFTGPRAMEFKISYIEAFDQMELALQHGGPDRVPDGMCLVNVEDFLGAQRKVVALLEENNVLLRDMLDLTQNAGRSRVNFSAEEDEIVIRMHGDGCGPAEIGKRIGRLKSSVRSCIHRLRKSGRIQDRGGVQLGLPWVQS